MTDTEKLAKLVSELRILAARSTRYEMNPEFNPADDGDFNEAYNTGHDDGRTELARDILDMIKALST